MNIDLLRQKLGEFLKFSFSESLVYFTAHDSVEEEGYRRYHITYKGDEGDEIPAFLLIPRGKGPFGAVLIHHQHAGQRHFGKSEVCGLVGDPLQAFGPLLAKRGIVVLAPDSICFEDRRKNGISTIPNETADTEQHFNEMSYRLVRGDTLMRKVLTDSAQAITLLRSLPQIDRERIGILGHSYGGNTVLFHAAIDERIRVACSSGAACSYQFKMSNDIGIEAAEVIPNFAAYFDIHHLVACFAPRKSLIVSASEDKYSRDADEVVAKARELCDMAGIHASFEHTRFPGGHPITKERFDYIINWITDQLK